MKPVLTFVHGAMGSGVAMQPLAQVLEPYAAVEAPDLLGHGGRPVPERFSVEELAGDLVATLDARGIEATFLLGYSSGGYLALYIARHFPRRVLGVCTLATKYVFDAATVRLWTRICDPGWIARSDHRFPGLLTRLHAPQDWTLMARRHAAWFRELGEAAPLSEADLRAIEAPALVSSGEADQIVPWAETIALARLLRCKVLAFHGQAHPIEDIPLASVAEGVGNWLTAAAGRAERR
jgi:pimeloyl-ACP methyl ester carboxylesterase